MKYRRPLLRCALFALLALGLVPDRCTAQGMLFNGNFGPFAPVGPGGLQAGAGFGFFGPGRTNMSVVPVLNLYNGQTALMAVQGFGWSPVGDQVVGAGGGVAFVPQFQPVPLGLNFPVQAVYVPMRDFRLGGAPATVEDLLDELRRPVFPAYVRANVAPTMSIARLAPPFPVSTFITPVFAGGAQGAAIPFTQIVYPPSFGTVGLNTTVSAPVGGSVLLGRTAFGGFGRNSSFPPLAPGANPFFFFPP